MRTEPHPVFLTTDQLAERWHVKRKTVIDMRHRGELHDLPAIRMGRHLLFRLDHIEKFEQNRRDALLEGVKTPPPLYRRLWPWGGDAAKAGGKARS